MISPVHTVSSGWHVLRCQVNISPQIGKSAHVSNFGCAYVQAIAPCMFTFGILEFLSFSRICAKGYHMTLKPDLSTNILSISNLFNCFVSDHSIFNTKQEWEVYYLVKLIKDNIFVERSGFTLILFVFQLQYFKMQSCKETETWIELWQIFASWIVKKWLVDLMIKST